MRERGGTIIIDYCKTERGLSGLSSIFIDIASDKPRILINKKSFNPLFFYFEFACFIEFFFCYKLRDYSWPREQQQQRQDKKTGKNNKRESK